jgi:hypothetical protein
VLGAHLGGLDNARLLSASLPETFIGQSFPGGAIDHILVAGSLTDRFQDATDRRLCSGAVRNR